MGKSYKARQGKVYRARDKARRGKEKRQQFETKKENG